MSDYQSAYSFIISKLQSTLRKEHSVHIVHGVVVWLLGVTAMVMLACLLEWAMNGNISTRTILFYVVLCGIGALAVWSVGGVVWRRFFAASKPTIDSMALRVGNAYEDIKDMLLNAMQLVPLISESQGTSSSLALAAFSDVSSKSANKDFAVVIDTAQTKKYAVLLGIVLAVCGLALAFSPLGFAAHRLLHFQTSFLPPAPYSLEISPKSKELLRGERALITVKATGSYPQQITLHVRETMQENFDTYILREDSVGLFSFEVPTIKQSVEFYASSPWHSEFVLTDTGRISVIDRPIVRSLSGRVLQPSYTGLPAQVLSEQSADISCLVGSRAELTVAANKDLASARVVYVRSAQALDDSTTSRAKTDTSFIGMSINSRTATTAFTVNSAGMYYIELKDKSGLTNLDPVRYSVQVQNDGFPTISLLEPSGDASLGKDALLPVKVAITDDYGFSALAIHYRLIESKYAKEEKNFSKVAIPLGMAGTSAEIPYTWDLNKIGISPADKYEFYIEVTDNDKVSGPKSAKTSVVQVKLPTLEEMFKQAQKKQESAQKDLQDVMKKAEEVAKEMQELQRELMKQTKPTADWKDKKKMEDLLQKQEQMQQKLDEAQQKLEEMTQMLQENKMLSPETLQKYQELQKLMEKIDSKELREQMQKMQEAMQQMSPEQLQQAMKNFKFSEEDFKKQIDRTMQLLKKMQAEQKMDELTKRAEEMQKQQEQMQKDAQNTNPNDKNKRDELAQKESAMKQDMQKLQQDAKDLENMMKDLAQKQNMPMDEMKKAMEQMQADQTMKEMENAEQNLEQGDMQEAQQNMKNAAQNMKNFAQQMKKMKQEMRKNQMREQMRQMQSAMNDMMQLSKDQEKLQKEMQNMDPSSTKMNQNAQQQQRIQEQMANLANRMQQLSQKSTSVTPEMGKNMGDAMRQMQNAQQSMEQRNPFQAGQQQQQAMASMNQAMQQMQGSMQQMMSGQGKPGAGQDGDSPGDSQRPGGQQGQSFMQKLQQAAGMQQQINQGMQQMPGNGGQLSQQQQGELGRLAAQQGKVQKSMQELAKEQKEMSGGKKQALGDLEKMAQDMKEILADMQSGNITEETRRRQEKILSRLLDASRSMNERDYEKQRESRAGVDVSRKSPPPLDISTPEGKKRAMQDLLRSIQTGYTKDYEQIIRQYFEQVQRNGSTVR